MIKDYWNIRNEESEETILAVKKTKRQAEESAERYRKMGVSSVQIEPRTIEVGIDKRKEKRWIVFHEHE